MTHTKALETVVQSGLTPSHGARVKPYIENKGRCGDDGDGINLDPRLLALLRLIPSTEAGWPREQRVRWFRTFAMNVSQFYDKPEEAVDLKIEAITQS